MNTRDGIKLHRLAKSKSITTSKTVVDESIAEPSETSAVEL